MQHAFQIAWVTTSVFPSRLSDLHTYVVHFFFGYESFWFRSLGRRFSTMAWVSHLFSLIATEPVRHGVPDGGLILQKGFQIVFIEDSFAGSSEVDRSTKLCIEPSFHDCREYFVNSTAFNSSFHLICAKPIYCFLIPFISTSLPYLSSLSILSTIS